MKLSVLALDYDGTIATDRGVDAEVRRALAHARTDGITVLPVTGRVLSELRRVAGDLHFVDGTVAENGAVVHLERSDFSRWIGAVFGDRALAAEIGAQEQRFANGIDGDTIPEIVSAIRGRYDLTDDDEEEPRVDAAARAA